jgi:hypothetical protein
MTVTSKVRARTAAATSGTTLYTAPSTTSVAVVTNIVLSNAATAAVNATISMDNITLIPAVSIAANSVVVFDMKQVLPADATPKTITGFATTTDVTIHISGVEIS